MILGCGMKKIFAAMIFATLPVFAMAEADHQETYECLENIETSTTWGQCLGQIFGSCDGMNVGSEEHVACLSGIYDGWFDALEGDVVKTSDALPPQGKEELANILPAWNAFTTEKCEEIGAQKAQTAGMSAQLGCQISETVLLANELRNCRLGRSSELYCVGVSVQSE